MVAMVAFDALIRKTRTFYRCLQRHMRTPVLALKVLLITLAAIACAYCAVAAMDVSGIAPTSWTAAELIRHRCPVRLIQPEWVSSQPDTLMNWLAAELRARLAVVGVLWLIGSAFVVRRHWGKRKRTNAV
jgi:hypothetical protein